MHISMETFELLSNSDIKQLLMKSSNAFFELDAILPWLVKKCQVKLIKVIRKTVNFPEIFPQSVKASLLKPLIKKPNLD